MKLLVLTGPQAVGKMTIGQEIQKRTGLKLFHNHMTIDLVSNFFSYSTEEGKKLVNLFRHEIFKAVAKSELEGLIFTFVWEYENPECWAYLEELTNIFKKEKGEVYYAELESDLEVRLERNKTPNRLKHKPTKRDIAWTEDDILKSVDKHRLNSLPGEIKIPNYIKINNTNKTPEEVAGEIIKTFNL